MGLLTHLEITLFGGDGLNRGGELMDRSLERDNLRKRLIRITEEPVNEMGVHVLASQYPLEC